jgi:4-hydroxy-2-oxoheptanedioate aldolase
MTPSQPLPDNRFKRNLGSSSAQIGLWLTLDSLSSTEMVAGAGYDWLLLDMEHTCIDSSQVVQHLRAVRGGTAEMMVRVPTIDAVLLKRLLDSGVRTLMFPQVNSAADAARAVAATRYPPYGIRGVAGNMRANNFNRFTEYFEQYHEQQCVIIQLETPQALDAIEEIGRIDGVDGLFIGPNDLAASMGYLGKPGAPEVRRVIADAVSRIRATGKAAGILNFDVAEAKSLIAAGFSFVAVGSDGGLLARRSEALAREFR